MSKKVKIVIITLAVAICVAVIATGSTIGALAETRRSVGVVPNEEQLAAAVKYERVLILGVDGAGNYFQDVNTPNFDRIFASGSVNYHALSQYPTTSAHNWTAMMHGVRYQKHGVNNQVAAMHPYRKTKYPSIFRVCAEAYPTAKMVSLTGWYPINYGIIEDMDQLIKYNGPKKHKDDPMLAAEDIRLKDAFIQELQGGLDPKIAFMYFAQVDEYGHADGRGESFYQAIERVDGYLGEVYDQYVANGWADNTLFVLVTDHGHRKAGGHGYNSVDERTTTIAVAGGLGNIIKGQPEGKAVTQDVASIVLYALGLKQPDTWESKVPYGIFNTLPVA